MKPSRFLAAVLTSFVLSTLLPQALSAQTDGFAATELPAIEAPKDRPMSEADPDTVLVKFENGTREGTEDAALDQNGAAPTEETAGATGYEVAELDPGVAPAEAVRALERNPNVADAQLNYVRHSSALPNDPALKFGDQEYLKKIRLPAAWDITKGSTGRTIAVIDTGIDTSHPDLAGRIKPGFNAITGTSNVNDDNGHGTIVAGIAAAITNNNRGVAGAAWNAGIMPIKALAADGSGTDADIAEGITWAADHGASVIVLSLGGPGSSAALSAAVIYARDHNVVMVGAAGNSGSDVPSFPAAYGAVLAVSATDTSSVFAHWSNYGSWVDVAAPGRSIVSPVSGPGEDYAVGDGTSFAAPLVAGVALLVRTKYPAWTWDQVLNRIRNSAQDFGPRGIDPFYGFGRVDAYAAVTGVKLAPAAQPAGDAFEPNPVLDRAKALTSSLSASISPEGDNDWFYRDVASAGTLTLTVTPSAYADRTREMDPVLDVYAPSLARLAHIDSGYVGQAEQVKLKVTPGRYYLNVSNWYGSRSFGNYTLASTLNNAIAVPNLEPAFHRTLPLAGNTAKIADITGDGRKDAVVTTGYSTAPTNGHLYVFAQQASGFLSFDPVQDLDLNGADVAGMGLATGDVNGDQLIDAVVGAGAGLQVFLNSGTALAYSHTVPVGAGGAVAQVEIVDLDADTDADFVTFDGTAVSFLRNDGAGVYTPTYMSAGGAVDAGTGVEIGVGDFNNDGRLDLVRLKNFLSLWFQNANGTFTTPTEFAAYSNGTPFDLAVGDLNNDGRKDLTVLSTNTPKRMTIRYLNADGSFTIAGPSEIPTSGSAEAGDMNRDGLVDLMQSDGILLQRPGFALAVDAQFETFPEGVGRDTIELGDLSGDARLDLLMATDDGLAFMRQSGPSPLMWVKDHAPADFAPSAATTFSPTIEFPRSMDATTFNASTVNILNGRTGWPIGITRSYNSTTRTLTLNPTANLAKNFPYIVTMNGVKDLLGQTLLEPYSFRFKTVA
jgi:subtilisin family serine protease